MNMILEQINSAGLTFVQFAFPVLVQSSVLIVILLLVDFLLRRKMRAVFRYWLWMLVLVKLILPSSLSSPLSLGYWFGDELRNVKITRTFTDTAAANIVEPEPVEASTPIPVVMAEIEPATASAEPIAAEVTTVQLSWQGVVFLVWLTVVIVMGLLLLQRVIFVIGLVAQAKKANNLMDNVLKFCCRCMGIKGEVGLKVSPNATSPAVCGLFRPVILVPENLAPSLGSSGLRTVLMHELAHIKRADCWVNLAQTVLQIIYFYNPLLWLANCVIRRVREQAVDEAVLVAMGEKAKQYPETLLNVAKLAFKRPALSLRLIGVVESKSTLQARIKRILNRPIPKSAKLGVAGLLAVIVTAVILLPMAKAESGPPGFLIKGTVTDAETGQPISGAKVGDVERYAGGKLSAVTDSNGNYSYLTWYEEHGIKAEATGYKTQHKGLYTKLLGSEKEKVLDFALEHEESSDKIDYSSVIVKEGVGFDDIIVRDVNCTGEFIKSKLGEPDKEVKNEKDWWLNYRKTCGLGFWVDPAKNVLVGIRLNKGFKGKLTSGISMSSTKQEVFGVYGEPVSEKTVRDLHKHFENQVLYKKWRLFGKPENSRMFYTQHGLLFWFEGDHILQIVIHPKETENSISLLKTDVKVEAEGTSEASISAIDVAIEDFNICPYPEGGLYSVVVSIRNKGDSVSPEFGVYFYRNYPDKKEPMTHAAGPIKPGDVWNERSMPFALKEGVNEIAVVLDPDNKVVESDETNNRASMRVVVKDGRVIEKSVKTDVKVEVEGASKASIGAILLPMAKAEKQSANTGEAQTASLEEGTSELKKTNSVSSGAPVVVKTTPVPFSDDVSPSLRTIKVTFDQPMMNLSWSWVGGGDTYPKMTGKPRYNRDKTTCMLPVRLQPGKFYWVGINSPKFKNFQTDMGVPAVPYVILFATKDKDGRPTPIPENYLEEAREINSRSKQNKSAASAKPAGLQGLIDSARPGGTVMIPKGVYTEPIEITKSLTLKGESRADCVFQVTADKPAIFIDTKGKGRVTVEDVTIKWQLATSDRVEHPFALGVKDTKAEVRNCNFVPLGNFKRSPVAIRAIGFSELTINTCRFEGFEYVVCYGESTNGTVKDSIIMDCGHQGIINYSGSTLRVERNVITGSKFHAVRSTGGTLHVRDNLIINNANRGVYLGNKSARGTITNNVIMRNGTGISGFAQSKVKIENNVIADSSYAGIGMRNSCSLLIRNNIFQGNERGWILFKEGSKGGNTCNKNTFWQNKTDAENFSKTRNSILAEPGFVDPENGDFSLKAGPALEHKQGLTNPQVFKTLWKRWQNREDKNEPFISTAKTDVQVEVEGRGAKQQVKSLLRVYEVDRSVADFPEKEDFSTPEAAYASINQVSATGNNLDWARVSVERLAKQFLRAKAKKRKVNQEWADVLLNARILEVRVWKGKYAMVMAELPQEFSSKKVKSPIDLRSLEFENSRWLNAGNSRAWTIEEGRAIFAEACEYHEQESERELVRNRRIKEVMKHPEEIIEAAEQLFEKIRNADYDAYSSGPPWKEFPIAGYYMTRTRWDKLVEWICKTFKANPIVSVELGKVFIGNKEIIGKKGWPTVPYKLTLKDGTVLEGDLAFEYNFDGGKGHWHGMEGIDWHLQSKPGVKPDVQVEGKDGDKKSRLQIIDDKELNISIAIPADWNCYKNPSPGRYKFSWQLIPSELKAWAMLIGAELTDEITGPVRQIAVGDAATLKSFFDKYKVRDDSWIDTTISELPATQFAADYVFEGKQMVEYRTYILGEHMVYWFVFRIEKELFEANKSIFDSIINSFKLDSENAKEVGRHVPQAAIDSALGWLKVVDDGDYSRSWDQAAGYFKSAVSKEQWQSSLAAVRAPLGKVISREVKSKRYTKQVPAAPDGEYVIIEFEISFENKKAAIETVTPMLDKDGLWRVSGYYIK